MRHKTKLIEFVIILMAFFILSGCDPEPDDDNEGGEPFEIDDIIVRGDGCRYEDTYKVELNSNDEGDTITVETSALSATTDEENFFGTSTCIIRIPINVPSGMSVGLAGIDNEGTAYIPSGGMGKVSWTQWSPHNDAPFFESNITTYDEEHEFSFKSTAPVLWSECGEDGFYAAASSTILIQRDKNSSIEVQEHISEFKFHLKWKECK